MAEAAVAAAPHRSLDLCGCLAAQTRAVDPVAVAATALVDRAAAFDHHPVGIDSQQAEPTLSAQSAGHDHLLGMDRGVDLEDRSHRNVEATELDLGHTQPAIGRDHLARVEGVCDLQSGATGHRQHIETIKTAQGLTRREGA